MTADIAPHDRARYWDDRYEQTGDEHVSWHQARPNVSLELIDTLGVEPSAGVIDVGGGSSRLVDELVARDFTDLTVLDVSPAALDIARRRLDHPAGVTWLPTDILTWTPDTPMGPVARPRRLPLPHRTRRPRHLPPPSRRRARAGRRVHHRHVRQRRPRPLLRPPRQPLQHAGTRRHHPRRHPRRHDQRHPQRDPRHAVRDHAALHLDRRKLVGTDQRVETQRETHCS